MAVRRNGIRRNRIRRNERTPCFAAFVNWDQCGDTIELDRHLCYRTGWNLIWRCNAVLTGCGFMKWCASSMIDWLTTKTDSGYLSQLIHFEFFLQLKLYFYCFIFIVWLWCFLAASWVSDQAYNRSEYFAVATHAMEIFVIHPKLHEKCFKHKLKLCWIERIFDVIGSAYRWNTRRSSHCFVFQVFLSILANMLTLVWWQEGHPHRLFVIAHFQTISQDLSIQSIILRHNNTLFYDCVKRPSSSLAVPLTTL